MTIEYLQLTTPNGGLSDEDLNNLGSAGWELIQILELPDRYGSHYVAIFKRMREGA
jgi:hypothetical protein